MKKLVYILFILSLLISINSCDNINKIRKKKQQKEIQFGFGIRNYDLVEGYNSIPADLYAKLENYYKSTWESGNLSGGFLVAIDNKIVFERYSGMADIEANIPITNHSAIHLASISKNLTAMMILNLVQKKYIKLDQKVNTILKEFPYQNINIQDLLTHRSGLPNYQYYSDSLNWNDTNKRFTNNELYQMFVQYKPNVYQEADNNFSYSNTNYALLALIIEKITGKTYPEAMKKYVFEPLNMENSFVFEKNMLHNISKSYYNNGKFYNWTYLDYIYGDKNIYSTPRDLLKYSLALFDNTNINEELMKKAMQGYSNERAGIKNYGFGFRMLEWENGKKLTFHSGWWHGNNTMFIHLPDEKVTIIALGNKYSRSYYSASSIASLFGDYQLSMIEDDSNMESNVSTNILQKTIDTTKNSEIK